MKTVLIRKSMMRVLPTFLLAVIAVPALAAGNRDDVWSLSPFVGGHAFDDRQSLETSPTFGLRAGYNFTPRWTAEGAFGYTLAESKVANYPETDAWHYSIDGLYHFNPEGKLVPFLALGIGGAMLNRPAPGFSDSDNTLLTYGVGLKYFIVDSVALRGDLRQVMMLDNSDTDLVYTVGVAFLIGGK